MEEYIENLQEIADAYEKRPSWDKLGEDDPSNKENQDFRNSMDPDAPPKKTSSAYWQTTNSQYGRFQTLRAEQAAEAATSASRHNSIPSASAINKSLESFGIRPASARDPGASARSRADSVARDEAQRTEERADAISRMSTADKPIQERRLKYLTLHGTEQAESDAERKKLTTGYAKTYMTTSHPRFYDNVRSVAKDAGFETPAPGSRHGSRQDTQILKVEQGANDNFEDLLAGYDVDLGTYGVQDSAPPSRQSSANRQKGYY